MLLSNSKVTLSIDLRSHPISRGACKERTQSNIGLSRDTFILCLGLSGKTTSYFCQCPDAEMRPVFFLSHPSISHFKHVWICFSFTRIPILLSGDSIELTRICINYSKIFTVPRSWSCIRCPSIILICYQGHANKQTRKRKAFSSSCFTKIGKKTIKEQKPFPVILDVSCCSPTVANISCPSCWILLSPALTTQFLV